MSDSAAFHEIDDAVRKDELKEWWSRWGTWVVAAVMIVVVVVAAYVGWRKYDEAQRAAAGAAYTAALAQIQTDPAAARAAFEKQATSAPQPYKALAALVAAQLRPTAEEQVAALESVAPTLSLPELNDLALVIAAYRSIDTPKAADAVARLDPLAAPDRAFHLSVKELQAILLMRKGDMKKARELWTEISKDPAVPQGSLQRATAMLNLYAEAETK